MPRWSRGSVDPIALGSTFETCHLLTSDTPKRGPADTFLPSPERVIPKFPAFCHRLGGEETMTRDEFSDAIVLDALRRFMLNSDLSDRRISRLMGVEIETLRTWASGKANPRKDSLMKIRSFLRWHGRKYVIAWEEENVSNRWSPKVGPLRFPVTSGSWLPAPKS